MRGSVKRLLIPFFLSVMTAALWGCGGGSKGTGGSGFEGRVLTKDSNPAVGVMVTLLETGAFGVTDEQGQFMFDTAIPAGSANLRVETTGLAKDLVLTDLSPDAKTVSVIIQISVEEQAAEIIDVSVEEHPPTPKPRKPTRSPGPDGKPGKTPTAAPSPIPGPTAPGPAATATPAPSASPSVAPTRTPDEHDDEGEDVEAEGPIQSITGNAVTVRSLTFTVNVDTIIRVGEHPAAFEDLTVGLQVHIQGRRSSGVLYAEDIEIAD